MQLWFEGNLWKLIHKSFGGNLDEEQKKAPCYIGYPLCFQVVFLVLICRKISKGVLSFQLGGSFSLEAENFAFIMWEIV